MPTYIVKAAPDEDFYVAWSTIVDTATAWGSRAHLAHEPALRGGTSPERFERADTTGTSADWPGFAPDDQPYGWSDGAFLVGNPPPDVPEDGWWELPRENLRAFCEAIESKAPTVHLLRRIPDDDA